MTLLTYNSKYVVQSTTPVTTTSNSLQDDTQASQTFTLSASQTVLAIYQANNNYATSVPTTGMQHALSIDSSDVANSWTSSNDANFPVRNCIFWLGTMASGEHTIKGRFASNTNTLTATVSNRILLIYILNGNEFQYIDDATARTSSSSTLGDDASASVTFTPSGNCVALYIYNCSNIAATEISVGKKAAISVNGTDYSQSEKSPYSVDFPDSVFTVHSGTLINSSTTVKGRFASNGDLTTVTIDRRQLGVLLFSNDTLMNIITSDTQVTTTSNDLVDDDQATISRTTTDTRELLVIAMGTKRRATNSSSSGECYGISVDSSDKQVSRGSPHETNDANSAATVFAMTTSAASHTVQGRFSNNTGSDSAKIDSRRVVALWLNPLPALLTFTDNKIMQWVMS